MKTRFLLLFFVILFWLFNMHAGAESSRDVSMDNRAEYFVPVDSNITASDNGNLRLTVWKGSAIATHELAIFVNDELKGTFDNVSTSGQNSGPHVINTSIEVADGDSIDIQFGSRVQDQTGYFRRYSQILTDTVSNPTLMTRLSKPFTYADGLVYCGAINQAEPKIELSAWMGSNSNNLIGFYCFEDDLTNNINWDHNDLILSIDLVPQIIQVLSQSCYIPDSQNNPDSNSCSNILRPLIQKKTGDPNSLLTITNNMASIDPTTKIVFDWADSIPSGSSECEGYYGLKIWEVNSSGNIIQDVVSIATNNSQYEIAADSFDFGKSYRWQIASYLVQKNLCAYSNPSSDVYSFTTNSFPFYIQSGVAYQNSVISNDPVLENTNPVSNNLSSCEGNANCSNLSADQSNFWGGNNCFSGNPIYTDQQPPVGLSRTPDNPITFWFEYLDPDNKISDGCLQNEMLMHRFAMVKKGEVSKLTTNNLETSESVLEIGQKIQENVLSGFYFEFDISGETKQKSLTINNTYANIQAFRFLDIDNRMRIAYKIQFNEGLDTSEYEVFASILATAFDPRGIEVRSSVQMFDIPFDWDNTDFDQSDGFYNAIECTPQNGNGGGGGNDDDDDDDCTCPGACCDKYGDVPDDSNQQDTPPANTVPDVPSDSNQQDTPPADTVPNVPSDSTGGNQNNGGSDSNTGGGGGGGERFLHDDGESSWRL